MPTARSKRNVQVVERMYESFADGDMDAVVDAWTDDVELHEPEGIVVGGVYRWHEAVLVLLGTVAGMYEGLSATPERYVDGGDIVVVLGTGSGTAAATGNVVEFPFAHVYDFEDGKISRWTSYIDTALFNAAHED